MNWNPKIFGINFPMLTWPMWFFVLLILVSGRVPVGTKSGEWRSFFRRRDKEPITYWLVTGFVIVITVAWTAAFNR